MAESTTTGPADPARPVPARPAVPEGQLFIGGEWREASGGRRRDVVDPSTGKVVTTVAEAEVDDLDAAVAAARKAFESGPWPRLSPRERARVLMRAADLLRERVAEFAALESVDVGKPIMLAQAWSWTTCARTRCWSGWSRPGCATPTSAWPPVGCRSRCPASSGARGPASWRASGAASAG